MPAVLDSLVCFLSMFSHITTEYVIEKGEKASAQLSLVSLLGIVCKLGYILGKSWEEVMHVFCHLEFLGLFDGIDLVHHQCILLSDNESVDLTAMVDGLVEEYFSTRTGLFSRLFSWSSEEDQTEQNIQMASIDSQLWTDLSQTIRNIDHSSIHPNPRETNPKGSGDDDDDDDDDESYEEEEKVKD